MATQITVVHSQDVIRAAPDGKLDYAKAEALIAEIASASAGLADHRIFVDTRHVESVLSVGDLWYLASELSKGGKTYLKKTAVLCPLEAFDSAGFFAICAQNRGYPVEAFTSFEEAVEWLIADPT
jgi:hypothetical protein